MSWGDEMTLDAYQEYASTVAQEKGKLADRALGLAGELGELSEQILKEPGDKKALADHLGDLLWYLVECASAAGLRMDSVAKENIRKLEERNGRELS